VSKIPNSCFSSVVYLVSTVENGKEYFQKIDVEVIDIDVYKTMLGFYEKWKNRFEKEMEDNEQERDRYMRLQAEFDNYKKRVHKERNILESQTKYNTLAGIIDIIDDLELARKNEPNNEGFQLIFSKLESYLQKQGVEEVDCEGNFDSDRHECLTVLNLGEDKYNQIVEVVQKGYMINGNIVRYPKVVISK
jgi:molecular chaperone GrpE